MPRKRRDSPVPIISLPPRVVFFDSALIIGRSVHHLAMVRAPIKCPQEPAVKCEALSRRREQKREDISQRGRSAASAYRRQAARCCYTGANWGEILYSIVSAVIFYVKDCFVFSSVGFISHWTQAKISAQLVSWLHRWCRTHRSWPRCRRGWTAWTALPQGTWRGERWALI